MTQTPDRPPTGKAVVMTAAPAPARPATVLAPIPVSWWPAPSEPIPTRLLIGALAGAAVAAFALVNSRLGAGVAVAAVPAVAALATLRPRRVDASGRWLLGLAVALTGVAAVRDSPWLVGVCLLGTVGLTGLAVTGTRSWVGALFAAPMVWVASWRSPAWLVRTSRGWRRPATADAWLRGGLLGAILLMIFTALLGSADETFSHWIYVVTPQWNTELLPLRLVVFAAATAAVLGAGFAVLRPPPSARWAVPIARRHPAEWALPLLVVDLILTAFIAAQASELYGDYTRALSDANVTYADRAKQGFWQLVTVTVLVTALLGLTGRCADPQRPTHRRLLAGLGGPLIGLTLAVVISALRRMYLYEQAYGYTVLRVTVAAAEVWLGVMLIVIGLAWLTGRTAMLPRVVPAGAGIGLLLLAVLGPDAVVARWDVDRFTHTGKIDVQYLSTLSSDAVPALADLPQPQRSCVFAGRSIDDDPWYAANVSRTVAGPRVRSWALPVSEARLIVGCSDLEPQESDY